MPLRDTVGKPVRPLSADELPNQIVVIFAPMVPLFWLIPFVAASGHCLTCLDGLLYLPVAFLTVVCFQRLISGDRK